MSATEPPAAEELRPVAVPMTRIVEVGLGVWVLALVATLVVPALQHIRNRWANRDVRELEQQRTATAVSVGLAMGAAA